MLIVVARSALGVTRNDRVHVFADELDLSLLVPVIRGELVTDAAGLQPFPEVARTLRKLRAAGKRVAVCSNLAHEFGQVVRQLLSSFYCYALSYGVGAATPDPAIYSAAGESSGSCPRDVLFVGVSMRRDVQGPQAFGMQAYWLDRHGGQTLMDVLRGVVR